ncbi:thiol:disulfide interchange protein DsbA [Candidatus Blochmanniella camponoti]|uniref:Thiol:disulfide interchange protein n=1 Tax=Candidatus Blochmanniella camponoti TaxID=108080 RepID=A0AAE9I9R0_9ENTR|nr:thiol:disulfide interchange protein DsbA [Candidatus Blochmannia herculeanus]URJ24837.1 thiol:disulfide interchange protein DsbA [Candidatus Blochmannia herculeanus]URJ27264.1 thiol:disulfide interchange protein DsbA [Candidatus Blochmannia herculeanus]URJ27826.1 thiol:disulfide interchange protein DsbA [Candidatus Blochmannia herculeanus]
MKKLHLIWIVIHLIFSCKSISSSITEGRQYIRLNKPIHNAPQLLEFFSFYCPHCYQFEEIYHISNNIEQTLPKNVNFYKYHVNFLGNLGKQLTHAWAVAIALRIENRISPILFTAIQKQQSIHTVEDIREIFIKSGVNAEEFDIAWDSVLVKSLILDQEQAAINFRLRGVPSIFINGKYMIKNEKLDISSVNAYIKQFCELLNLLIDKT